MWTLDRLDVRNAVALLAIIGIRVLSRMPRVAAATVADGLAAALEAASDQDLTIEAGEHMGTLPVQTRQVAVLTVLLVMASVIPSVLVSSGLRGWRMPRRLEIVDNRGDGAPGAVVSGLAATLAAMPLSILLSALNQSVGSTESGTLPGAVDSQVSDSRLIPVLLDMAPSFTAMLEPLSPGGMPSVLDAVPRA